MGSDLRFGVPRYFTKFKMLELTLDSIKGTVGDQFDGLQCRYTFCICNEVVTL